MNSSPSNHTDHWQEGNEEANGLLGGRSPLAICCVWGFIGNFFETLEIWPHRTIYYFQGLFQTEQNEGVTCLPQNLPFCNWKLWCIRVTSVALTFYIHVPVMLGHVLEGHIPLWLEHETTSHIVSSVWKQSDASEGGGVCVLCSGSMETPSQTYPHL